MQKDIAFEYRVSKYLVNRLVKDEERRPLRIEELRKKREMKELNKDAVEDAAAKLLQKNAPIFRAQMVVDAVKEDTGLEVALPEVRKIMRKDL